MLSAPGETVPITRPQSRIRGIARLPAFAVLLVTLLGSALPSFAQTFLSSLTGINGPTFVALDSAHPAGTTWLYVSEHGGVDGTGTGGGRILKYNLTTGSTTPTVIAVAGNADGQFRSPDAILVDASGDLFIADRYLNRIQRITNTGTFVMKWGSSTVGAADELHGPVGLARDSTGAIYVTEHGDANGAGVAGNMVSKYTLNGTAAPTRVWRKGNGFNVPYGITVNGSSLLISDGFNAQVQVWDLNGNPTGSFPLAGVIPTGLYSDSAGAVWITESSDNGGGAIQRVEKRSAVGASLGVSFGSLGAGDGQFHLPFDAVVDAATNRIYVSDYYNNRVQSFNLSAAATDTTPPTVAVTGGSGSASPASFTVTFSENVTGVASGVFTATGSGGATPSGSPVVSGTGASYTVTVPFTGTAGQIALALNGTATTAIKDAANNAYAGGATAGSSNTATFTVVSGDTTPPTVASIVLAAGATSTDGAFTVTFSEAVTGVTADDFQVYTNGGTNATIRSNVTGSGTTWRVEFDYTGSTGALQMAIKTSGTGIADLAGNPFAGGGTTASDPIPNNAGSPDMTPPTVASFTAGTPSTSSVTFTLTFSEAVTGFTNADVTAITTGTVSPLIGAATGSGAAYTIPVTFTGTGTLQLRLVGGATTNIVDATGNVLATATTSATASVSSGSGGTAPVIANQAATGTQNAAFNYQVVATGATSYTIFGSPALPAGLSMSTSGAITGTPTAAGSTTVTVRATNTTGFTDAQLALTINPASTGTAPVIANQAATGTQNAAFNYQVVATGATSYTIFGSPALPAGLSMSTSGVITGTPTAAGSTTVTVRATNTTGFTDAQLALTINPASTAAAPVITSPLTLAVNANASFTYTIGASNSPTAFTATNRPAGVNFTSPTLSGAVATAGTYNILLGASNATGSDSKTLVLTVNPVSTPAVPVVTSATIPGTANTALTYQIVATNSPTGYSYSGTLPSGLIFNSATGLISGTPTAASGNSILATATNTAGASVAATLTFNIAGASVTPPPPPPPPSGGGGGTSFLPQTVVIAPVTNATVGAPVTLTATSNGGTNPIVFSVVAGDATLVGNVLTPKSAGSVVVQASQAGGGIYLSGSSTATIAVKASQTLTFNSPVSAIVIGQPVALSATSSAGLPVTFSVVSGSATLSGNRLTPTGPGTIVVRASQAGDDTTAAVSTDVNFGSPQKAAQSIAFSAVDDVNVTAGPIVLQATTNSGLPISYTLLGGPATLSGNVLTLTKASGIVTVRASQPGNDSYNAAAEITRTFNVRAVGQQVFLGTMGSDPFAVIVSADNAKGLFVTRFAATGEAIVAKFKLNANGTFSATGTSSLPASTDDANPAAGTPAVAAATQTRTINGMITNGVLNGTILELNRNFTATVASPTGATASLAGVYIASIPGSASGDTYLVVGPTGTAYAVSVTPLGVTSGTGTVAADGTINLTLSGGATLTGNVNATTGALAATLKNGNSTAALVGLSEATPRSDRLVNLSSRLRVVGGDASRSVIAGFVVSGTESKRVLVRAVGPGLTGFGVTDALANPKLQLFQGTTLVAENDDWNNNAGVSTTGGSVGAFPLGANSKDAALVATLAPGAYTAIVTGVGGNGVALIEVYDAATHTPLAAQELVNISTRGFVETGEGNLIAGFVVTGNAPKRVLIRGIGPSLAQFNVPNTLGDPSLKLYAVGTAAAIAQNDDWSTPQPINAAQSAASAADIAAASSATGAFPLGANSKDAALLITLMPGQYSAVVSGANNSTGAGLVEVYEVPNP